MTKTTAFLKKLIPGPVTAILLGLIIYLWFRPPAWVDDLAEPLPAAPALGDHRLDALRGQVVLVNFWATWCPYCRHEMPVMQRFYDSHRARGFEIVAYSLDKTQVEVDEFMRDKGYTFAAPLATPAVTEAFGGVTRVPLSFVIDRDGVIRHKIAGQVHAGRLDRLIIPLLDAPASPR